jgi:hypothetical protein
MKNMPSVDDIYPEAWLKAADIKKEMKIRVVKTSVEMIGEDRRIVLGFEEMDKGLVLNKTNKDRMVEITGSKDYTTWPETDIVLYTITTTYKKEEVQAIRIKKPAEEKSSADNDQNLLDEVFRRNA